MLFGLRGRAIDASLVSHGQFEDYRGFRADGPDEIKESVLAYKQHLQQKEGIPAPTKVILYGFNIASQLIRQIQKESGIATFALDSVRNLVPSKKIFEPYMKESSRFAAAIGLALRIQ
jgi:hypothetical protein